MVRITLCLALVAFAAPAAAQTARLSGSITDQSGALLPAVEVRAVMRDSAGETTRSVVTDSKGAFELTGLLPGPWVVTASVPGFETSTYRTTVQAGDALDWSPTLQLGMIQETVTITTDAPQGPARVELGQRETRVVPQTGSAAPTRAGGSATVRVGGSVKPPRKVVHVNPVYPPDAAAQGIGGVVILGAVIGTDGVIREVKTLRSPNESLTLAASNALYGWEFTPTLLNGEPVDTRITATFNFDGR